MGSKKGHRLIDCLGEGDSNKMSPFLIQFALFGRNGQTMEKKDENIELWRYRIAAILIIR